MRTTQLGPIPPSYTTRANNPQQASLANIRFGFNPSDVVGPLLAAPDTVKASVDQALLMLQDAKLKLKAMLQGDKPPADTAEDTTPPPETPTGADSSQQP